MSRLARCLRWSRFWCLWTCCWCSSSVHVNGSALGARFAAHHTFTQERRERQCALVESGDTRRSITATRWNEWRWYNIMYFCYPPSSPPPSPILRYVLCPLTVCDSYCCLVVVVVVRIQICDALTFSVVTGNSYPPHINMPPSLPLRRSPSLLHVVFCGLCAWIKFYSVA